MYLSVDTARGAVGRLLTARPNSCVPLSYRIAQWPASSKYVVPLLLHWRNNVSVESTADESTRPKIARSSILARNFYLTTFTSCTVTHSVQERPTATKRRTRALPLARYESWSFLRKSIWHVIDSTGQDTEIIERRTMSANSECCDESAAAEAATPNAFDINMPFTRWRSPISVISSSAAY